MASARPRPKPSPATPPAPDAPAPIGGDVSALLNGAVEEAARLLGADGAFLYLLDAETGLLRFTHSAGIAELPPDIRDLELPVGVGMFGKAVADRRVVVTGDYRADDRFIHAETTDRFVDEVGIRSMVVAPLTAGDEVFGALGTFSHAEDAFTAPQIALVRALADHAALAIANARLIAELARSGEAIERQAIIERSLRELGTRISGARDPGDVVQYTIDEALRLLDGDGARIDIVDPEAQQLRGMYSAGDEEILATEWPRDPDDRLEVGASGRAVTTGVDLHQPGLSHRREPRPLDGSRHVRPQQGHPRGHRHAAVRGPGSVRRDHGVVAPGGRLRAGGRRAPRDDRRAGRGRPRPRPPDRGARPLPRDACPTGGGGARPARDRARGSARWATTPPTCCCGS